MSTRKNVVKYFDFKETHKLMKKLNWTWATTYPEIPTIKELKATVNRLMLTVDESPHEPSVSSTGGFTVIRFINDYYIFFGYDSWFW